jgi:UDP-N-acetylmuramate dehydrogenase
MSLIKNKELLSKHTTLKIGGPAKFFCEPENIAQLKEALLFAKEKKLRVYTIGSGSNVLAPDKGFKGLVIKPKLTEIEIKGTDVTVGAGVSLPYLLKMFAEAGLSGLEFMVGIPGTVGGAVAMNAGTAESWIDSRLVSIWAMDAKGKELGFAPEQCEFGYRKSIFQEEKKYIITVVQLKLEPGDREEINKKMKEFMEIRVAKQPYDQPSAGSVFKNPENDYAGRLIEAAGLKGKKIGEAMIAKKHANFIVNMGGAQAKDVLALIHLAQHVVKKRFNVRLELEVEVM